MKSELLRPPSAARPPHRPWTVSLCLLAEGCFRALPVCSPCGILGRRAIQRTGYQAGVAKAKSHVFADPWRTDGWGRSQKAHEGRDGGGQGRECPVQRR